MTSIDLADWILRVSVLLLVGYVAARLQAVRSAIGAHRVLVATLISVVAFPLMTVAVPGWQIQKPGWLSRIETRKTETVQDSASATVPRGLNPQNLIPQTTAGIELMTDRRPEPVIAEQPPETYGSTSAALNGPLTMTSSDPQFDHGNSSSGTTGTIDGEIPKSAWMPVHLMATIWFIVAAVLLLRLSVAVFQLKQRVRRCSPACSSPDFTKIQRIVNDIAETLPFRRRVRVLISSEESMPMACWLGQWAIVLPQSITTWPPEAQQATVAHELGHVVRRDSWADYLSHVTASLLWFHPLSWMIVREIRRLRELACDEWVIQQTTLDHHVYARCLLQVVERCQTGRELVASAMAGSSELESRLRRLTTTTFSRTQRPLMNLLSGLSVVAFSAALAGAQLTETSTRSTAGSSPAPRETPAAKLAVIVSREPAPAEPNMTVRGIVTDENGQPLSGINVALRVDLLSSRLSVFPHQYDVLARTQTDESGKFELTQIRIPPRMVDDIRIDGKPEFYGGSRNAGAQLVVWGKQYGIFWQSVPTLNSRQLTIRMSPQASVTGTVVDDAGIPVANARLDLALIDRHCGNVDSMWGEPGNLKFLGTQLQFGTTTDAAGNFQIDHMPRDMRLQFVCRGPNAESGELILDTRGLALDVIRRNDAEHSTRFESERQGVRTFPIQKSPVLFRTTRLPAVRVRVTDDVGRSILSGGLSAVGTKEKYYPTGKATVDENGYSLLRVSHPGTYWIYFSSDPLNPVPGVMQQIEISSGAIKDFTMTIPSTKVLTGKVIDSDTGLPVTGAWIHCFRPDADTEPDPIGRSVPTGAHAVTGTDGVFRLPVTPGSWRLRLSDDLPGYLVPSLAARAIMANEVPPNVDYWKPVPREHLDVVVTNESIPQDIVIKVGRGLVIHGTVTDQNGQPEDSAMVQVSSHPGPGEVGSFSSQSFTTHTDVNGRFTFSGVSPYVPIRISAVSTTAAGEQQLEAIPEHAADMTIEKSVRIVTSPAITLTGRVVHEGKAIAGVSVRLFKQKASPPTYKWNEPDSDSPIHLAFETVTDSEGRYSVYGLQEGDRYFFDTFSHNGLVAAFWEYRHQRRHSIRSVAAGNIELPDAELVVGLGKRIPGVVVDPDGKPLPGIRIVRRLQSGQEYPVPESNRQRSRTRDASDITDDEGRFDVYLHPNQSVRLMASVHDSQTDRILYAAFENVNAEDTDVRIVLDSRLGTGIEDLDAAPALK
jgi:beta-lactamase regulating signal transducer with metallopeptidase domain